MKDFLKNLNPRSVAALMLAGTVCFIMVAAAVGAVFRPPGTVTETFRQKVFEILSFILGIVSGWLLGRGEPTPPPKVGDKDTKPPEVAAPAPPPPEAPK